MRDTFISEKDQARAIELGQAVLIMEQELKAIKKKIDELHKGEDPTALADEYIEKHKEIKKIQLEIINLQITKK